jgi:hypothetical protein
LPSGTARESENGGFLSVENGPQELAAPLLHAAALTGEQTIIDVDRLVRDRGFDASAAGPQARAIMTLRGPVLFPSARSVIVMAAGRRGRRAREV